MNAEQRDVRITRIPWGGLAACALAALAMAVASFVAWPEMVPAIVTREAGGNHGASVIPRGFTAVALPLGLPAIGTLLALAPWLDARVLGRWSLNAGRNLRNGVRVLNYTLAGLALPLTILHFGLLAMYTGRDFPLERAMITAIGLLFVLLGIVFPLARPAGAFASPRVAAFVARYAATYRAGAVVLVGLGLACIFLAARAPGAAMLIACGGLVALFAGMALTALIRTKREA